MNITSMRMLISSLILLLLCSYYNVSVSSNTNKFNSNKPIFKSKSFDQTLKDDSKVRNALDTKKHHFSFFELWSRLHLTFVPCIYPAFSNTKDIYSIFFGGAGISLNYILYYSFCLMYDNIIDMM